MKFLSLKTALLLTLTLATWVGDLHSHNTKNNTAGQPSVHLLQGTEVRAVTICSLFSRFTHYNTFVWDLYTWPTEQRPNKSHNLNMLVYYWPSTEDWRGCHVQRIKPYKSVWWSTSSFITIIHHHPPLSSMLIQHNHPPKSYINTICHHHAPLSSTTIIHHHNPPPSSIIINIIHHHHPSPSPTNITIIHQHQPSPSSITIICCWQMESWSASSSLKCILKKRHYKTLSDRGRVLVYGTCSLVWPPLQDYWQNYGQELKISSVIVCTQSHRGSWSFFERVVGPHLPGQQYCYS